MKTKEIKLRPLSVGDVFAIARMLGKITKGNRLQILAFIKGKTKNYAEITLIILQSLFVDAEEDLKEWLAELSGMDKTEFLALPAKEIIGILKQLASMEGIQDFLSEASQLVPEGISTETSTQSKGATDGQTE